MDAGRVLDVMATRAGRAAGGEEAGNDAEGQYAEVAVEALGKGGGPATEAGQLRWQDA
jgi:hypothetical protein